jgi:SAM-dependent methyltransferase
MDPKDVVRTGYDTVSFAYRSDDDEDEKYERWLGELAAELRPGARVLDLGCGCGVPSDRWLVGNGFHVTGVDFSPVQIERARTLVPGATFILGDIGSVEFEPASFDAAIALYCIFHLPLDEQRTLFASVRGWLGAGGPFLAILPAGPWTGTEENWLGAGGRMWWAQERPEVYDAWLDEAGFRKRWRRYVPEGDAGHDLVLAIAGATR